MLAAEGLSFFAGGREILRRCGFRAAKGELVAVCGGNGCGKTTLLKILCGLLPPEEGAVRWHSQNSNSGDNNENAAESRERFIYIGHKTGLCGELTPLENLRALAALRARPPKKEPAAALADWGANIAMPCRRLSAGQRQRAALARCDALRAEIWLLDEPLASLDSPGRELFCDALRRHLREGGAAAVTCHDENASPLPPARVVFPGAR